MTIIHSHDQPKNHAGYINKLRIKYVGHHGNTGDGAYLFAYGTRAMMMSSGNTLAIEIEDADSPPNPSRYIFYSYATTSPDAMTLMSDTLPKFLVTLSPHKLAVLALVVQDTTPPNPLPDGAPTLLVCDPQVGNDPQT
ncbi:MAG: hypothetical protein NW204_09295 [Xanthomonadaceae bacterium]|nr:hypothetical protein [Xanthomonadaceae bacterium]